MALDPADIEKLKARQKFKRRGLIPGEKPKKANELRFEEAQGTLMAVHRMLGKSLREIGAIFDLSAETVRKRLTVAQGNELLGLTQDLVKERLLPKALAVYETKLLEGDLEAARDVMFGTGGLSKSTTVKVGADPESLENWRERYFMGPQQPIVTIEGAIEVIDEDSELRLGRRESPGDDQDGETD